MPRHLRNSAATGRTITIAVVIVVLCAVALGVWRFSSDAAPSAAPGGAPTHPAATPSHPAGGPASSPATPSSAPSPTLARTGRVDTLDGLVPDYTLPPVEDGMVPVITKIPTEQKVVFLTIDDGAVKRESDLKLLEKNGVKASLFLAHTFIAGHAAFYKSYLDAGYLIEDHTMSHNLGFINLSFAQQKAEICGMADYEEQQFGRRPVFFRPPGGPYTQSVRRAAAECGMKAIVDWEAKANAGGMDYQVGKVLRPGEIVLMHFRPEFPADLAAFVKAQKAAGLKVVLLEDYLGVK
ncbi:polysaccharide deacetylase (plasmid) [Arthrobacter sp. ERGS1:01]|uniref:polysaccharide deacetylase family protein n=1 Tax=Arthrobacter sp. ERGS1:01 TaxID=1704044 RepID=UPI0006B429F7|nr:polysaccharide deacetylase family protein [Arthrobacter sp. ERGS1:01]ALE04391.1 polysaccharide deacetylase [Arthrobacter sp. ERGS1:01]